MGLIIKCIALSNLLNTSLFNILYYCFYSTFFKERDKWGSIFDKGGDKYENGCGISLQKLHCKIFGVYQIGIKHPQEMKTGNISKFACFNGFHFIRCKLSCMAVNIGLIKKNPRSYHLFLVLDLTPSPSPWKKKRGAELWSMLFILIYYSFNSFLTNCSLSFFQGEGLRGEVMVTILLFPLISLKSRQKSFF